MSFIYKGLRIDGFIHGGQTYASGWGVEFADKSSFYSMTGEGFGVGEGVSDCCVQDGSGVVVKLATGDVCLRLEESSDELSAERKVCIRAIDDVYLMDFVLRYRFSADCFDVGDINDKSFSYRGSNIYNQYQVSTVNLDGEKVSASVRLIGSSKRKDITPWMYLRDFNNEWIVHCRLLPSQNVFHKQIIKLNTSWYDRAVPDVLSNCLLGNEKIKKYLWYKGETKRYSRLNPVMKYLLKPAAYPLFNLKKGEELYIRSAVDFKIK